MNETKKLIKQTMANYNIAEKHFKALYEDITKEYADCGSSLKDLTKKDIIEIYQCME